jgi:hypothetical protein
MTDETELAIAGVTSLHESPRRCASKVALISQHIGMISVTTVESNKLRGGVIPVQRSGTRCAYRDRRGLHERASLKGYCGQQTSCVEDWSLPRLSCLASALGRFPP